MSRFFSISENADNHSLMRTTKLIVLCLALGSLAACETTTGLKIDYRSSGSQAPLEIPPDLDKLPGDTSDAGADTYSAYAAERAIAQGRSSTLLPRFKDIELHRDGDIRWLKIKTTKRDIWIDIKNFLGDVGLVIKTENPATGIIETDWAENRAKFGGSGFLSNLLRKFDSTGEMDRYRIRLEDEQPGNISVYLSHQGLVEKIASGGGDSVVQTSWQRRPSDPELEAEMLRLLMVYLGIDDKKASNLLASGIRQARALLMTDDQSSTPYLVIKVAHGRALRRLESAIDRMGAEVVSNEDGGNLITISYLLPKEEESNRAGFFSRIFTGGKKKPRKYRIRVTDAGSQTEARIVDKDNRPDTSANAGELTRILFDQLK